MMTIWDQLKAPFPVKSVHWRIGSKTKDGKKARVLAYIDARDVMKRLDDVAGPLNWEDHYREVAGRVVCELTLSVDGSRVTKSDGAGDTQVEAEKGGLSDAFKRAAVKFGIGRYLYQLDAPWVPINEYGNFTPPDLPVWATPEGYAAALDRRAA